MEIQVALPTDLTARQQAAAKALALFETYKGTIDSEEVKLFVNNALVAVKQELSSVKTELAGITDPLVDIRRLALTSKQNAENAFALYINTLERGERILKDEILRWEQLRERKRLEDERRLRLQAEQDRLAEERRAQEIAEEAARKNLLLHDEARLKEESGDTQGASELRLQAEAQMISAAEEVETIQEAAESIVAPTVASESVKMKGTAITGKWVSDVIDPLEVLAGIVDRSTPLDALRCKVNGRLVPVTGLRGEKIESIEINLAFFNDQARKQEDKMSYRGVKARFHQDLSVRA